MIVSSKCLIAGIGPRRRTALTTFPLVRVPAGCQFDLQSFVTAEKAICQACRDNVDQRHRDWELSNRRGTFENSGTFRSIQILLQ